MAMNSALKGTAGIRLLLGCVLIVGILYVAKPVLVPLALAILLAFILSPIVSAAQRYGLGRVPASVLTVFLALAMFGAVAWGAGIQINKLAVELPNHKARIQKKIADLRGSGESVFGKLLEMVRELDEEPKKTDDPSAELTPKDKEIIVRQREESSNFDRLLRFVVPVLEPLATAGFVVIMVIFMLVNREDLRNRLISLLGHGHLTSTTRAIVDAAQRVSNFLLTQLLINVAFGIIFSVGLLVIGVPYAFLWGFLIAVLRFIPYIGTWVGAGFPILLSFALAPDWLQPLVVLAFIAVLDLVTANVVEPLLFGHSTGVTPIALLIAAAFWTWIWGPIGLVLTTPLTVCLVVLGQHIPRLRFFTLLLGSQPPLKPHVNYYQRLLAKDVAEATQVAMEQAKTGGLASLGDEVLFPALVLARRDRKQRALTVEEEAGILQSTKEILTQVEQTLQPLPVADTVPPTALPAPTLPAPPLTVILGCPAHDEAEELSLSLLALLMKPDGCQLEIVSTKALPVEVEDRIAVEKPAIVFVPILPPGGLVQARYLCKRLRRRFKKLPIIVGYWGESHDFDRLLISLRSAGASYVTTSLVQTRSQICALIGAVPPPTPVPQPKPAEPLVTA